MRRLPLLIENARKLSEEDVVEPAPLPEPWAALYVGPRPDLARRNCGNCMMWAQTQQCSILDPKIKVTEDMICGYWVGGEPMPKLMPHKVEYVDPKLAGLEIVPDGTACDNCKWYEAEQNDAGHCHAVQQNGKFAVVHPRGCCARWEQ